MSDPYFQKLFAERIGGENYGKGSAIYKFEKIKRAKRAAREQFPDRTLLDFGIGENDEMAHESIRAVLKAEVDKPENRGYSDNGIQDYKEAAAEFLKREFGVKIDPATEVNHCIGTKPAYAMLPAAFINPGDITLMTVPGYPVAGTYTKYFGGEVYNLPLLAENNFLPDLDGIPAEIAKRAKLMVLNYPNSPTGALATREFYEKVIRFAKQKEIVIVQDAAHVLLSFGAKPLSFLEVDGAKDVGVEVHSMSKGFDMIGWRMGFVAGNARIVQAFADIKDNSDSGQFMAIQKAAAAALRDPSIPKRIRAKYQRRLEKLVATLTELGFQCSMPGGSYFLYTKSPKGVEGGASFKTAEEASQFLIREHSICTVPWDDAGAFLRFSVTFEAKGESAEDVLMKELKNRLSSFSFQW